MKCPRCNSKKKALLDLNLICANCRYIFGEKEKVRFFVREKRVLTASNFIFIFLIAVIFFFFVFPINYNNVKIVYGKGFSEKEINVISDIIEDLNPKYISKIKQIKIIKPDYTNDWIGINTNGWVVAEYDRNINNLKNTICHEILHSIINAVADEEFLVEDIAKEDVCYE